MNLICLANSSMRDLADKVIWNKPMIINGSSNYIDEEYAKDFYPPIDFNTGKK